MLDGPLRIADTNSRFLPLGVPPMRTSRFVAVFSLVAVVAFPAGAGADEVTIVPGQEAIEFKAGSTVAARYVIGPAVAKPYLYPVLTPRGIPVTRPWPMEAAPPMGTKDHVHQKSVWFCHGDVIPVGLELKIKSANKGDQGVDFWSEAKDANGPRHGTIKCVKVGEPKQHAKNHASIETHNEWIAPDGQKILDEIRVLHFLDKPEGRLFVFDITLKATVCPIRFGDTKEGSFGVRVRDELRMEKRKDVLGGDGVLSNSAGKVGEKEIWGLPADWVHSSGQADGHTIGIAVFNHPSNPQPSWHARAYGLVAANPFGRERSGFPSQKGKTDLLTIEKGGQMKLKYAVYAHDGDLKAGQVAQTYAEFTKW